MFLVPRSELKFNDNVNSMGFLGILLASSPESQHKLRYSLFNLFVFTISYLQCFLLFFLALLVLWELFVLSLNLCKFGCILF